MEKEPTWQNLDEGKTSGEFIIEGRRHNKNYNFYTAEASFKLAQEKAENSEEEKLAKLEREKLIRQEAYRNPTRAWLLCEDDEKDLLRSIAAQADKRKLELLRDTIRKML